MSPPTRRFSSSSSLNPAVLTRAERMQALSPGQNALVGSCAGTIEILLLQPMLYCKNASQQGLPLTLDPRVLYRGSLVSVGNMAALTSMQFPLTGMVTSLLTGGTPRQLSDTEMILAGFGGGAISGIACAPMECVMIQQQRFGGSLVSTPARMMREFGATSLFRGLSTAVGREAFFTTGYMGLGPMLSRKLAPSG